MQAQRLQEDRHKILTRALISLQAMGASSEDENWLEMILDEPVMKFLAGRLGITDGQAGRLFEDLKLLGLVSTKPRGPQKPLIKVKADITQVSEDDIETIRQKRAGGGGPPPAAPPPPPPGEGEAEEEVPEGYIRVDEAGFNRIVEQLVDRLKVVSGELEAERSAHAATRELLEAEVVAHATTQEELAKARPVHLIVPEAALEFLEA